MSLARLALRLAAIEALSPAAAATDGPWPTIAGNRVFDSRVDPIAAAETPDELDAALAKLEGRPLLVVYTEDDHTNPYGQAKYPAEEQIVTLVVEAMIAARGEIELAGPDGQTVTIGTLDQPVTDRQHEAMLDMIEASVRYVLGGGAPTSSILASVLWEIRSIHSDPQRADRAVRLAMRTIKVHCKVRKEIWPPAGSLSGSGLQALPDPLRSVAQALPDGSSGRTLCLILAGVVPPPGVLVPLAGITAYGALGRLPAGSSDADVVASVTTL